jgi:hypothetical protein
LTRAIGPKPEGDERVESHFHRGGYFDFVLEILLERDNQ